MSYLEGRPCTITYTAHPVRTGDTWETRWHVLVHKRGVCVGDGHSSTLCGAVADAVSMARSVRCLAQLGPVYYRVACVNTLSPHVG